MRIIPFVILALLLGCQSKKDTYWEEQAKYWHDQADQSAAIASKAIDQTERAVKIAEDWKTTAEKCVTGEK